MSEPEFLDERLVKLEVLKMLFTTHLANADRNLIHSVADRHVEYIMKSK